VSVVEVRLAHDGELARVGEITVEAYVDEGFIAPDADYVEDLADATARACEAEVWVAVEDGAVLGSVTFCPSGSAWAELARDGEGEFRMLGVAASARRRGVAEALVVRCIERSGELGYRSIVMSSMPQMAAAHRLYERLGFVRLPDRDWSPVEGLTLLAFTRPVS
jgi:ribosomal protein S18 acetylase RimI-like enzyme